VTTAISAAFEQKPTREKPKIENIRFKN